VVALFLAIRAGTVRTMNLSLLLRSAIAVLLGCLSLGCKRREDPGASSIADSASPAAKSPTGNDTTSPSPASVSLSDANIVYLLDEANMADSAAGAYALTKATSPEVKAYARLMMGEHHALRAQGRQLAQRLGVTPERPAVDPVQVAAQTEMAALAGATRMSGFDRTYIDQEIQVHRRVLDLAGKAHAAASSPELKQLIQQATPVIEKHLNRAEAIQKKVGQASP
jgi:putative membrane protein